MPDACVDSQLLPEASGWMSALTLKRWHLLLAGVCITAVYLVGVTGRWWLTADSALYLGLGRSLAEGNGYCFNGSVHNFVTPGLPLILAGIRIVFGPGFWAPNLFTALCGLTSILFVYLVIARLNDRCMALAVALATAFSFTFFYQSHRILTDAPFTALFWALLYAYLRYRTGSAWWLVLMGLLSVAAFTIRAPGILFLGPLAIGVLLDRIPPGTPASDAQISPRTARFRRIRKSVFSAVVILGTIVVICGGFYLLAHAYAESEPEYLRGFLKRAGRSPTKHFNFLWLGAKKLPFAIAEMFTSQESTVLAFLVGVPALLLGGIGAVSLWRRGQRFVLPVFVMGVLALAFHGCDHFIRPRYLMPLQPLLLLAMMEGICRCIKCLNHQAKATIYIKAITVLVGLIIACNAPKLLRNAVYYSYLSHTPRYYQVVRNGRFAEFFEIAEVIRRNHSDNMPAATNSGEVSILHFLSERVIIPMPKTLRRKPAHAVKIHRFATSRNDLKFIVLDAGKPQNNNPFRRRLKELFGNTPRMKLRHDGKQYMVYESAHAKGAQK